MVISYQRIFPDGRRQRRPLTSPKPGVRVHGSTHRPFQSVTASVACAGLQFVYMGVASFIERKRRGHLHLETKHAEAARLNYTTTTHRHIDT